METENLYGRGLPPQKISLTKKTEEWRKRCVDAIVGFGNNQRNSDGRSSRENKRINYDLVNSKTNPQDYEYVLNPYGATESMGDTPAKIRNYNIVINKINLLKGEEMSRPLSFNVVAKNGNAVQEKEEKEKEMLLQIATEQVARAAGIDIENPPIDPNTNEPSLPTSVTEFQKYKNTKMKNIREVWGNDMLEFLKEDQNLSLKFNEAFEHALISGEEIYYIGIVNKELVIRTCNPLNCEFDKNPDDPRIETGDWFREEREMTPGQIIDEFGEFLTDKEFDMIDKGTLSQNDGVANRMYPEFAYTLATVNVLSRNNRITNKSANQYTVTTVTWKTMVRKGFLKLNDPQSGEPIETIVGETFKMSPELKALGAEVTWTWIPEVWQGTRIASSVYVNMGPVPHQMRGMDNIRSCMMPYVGRVYGAVNSECTSLIDLLKPHQYLYNIIWYRLEAEIAKAKGKKFVMDLAQIPRSEGIDLDKWMYMFDNIGIAFINSFEEGRDRYQGQNSNFNQYSAIDMTLSQSIGQYIQILSKIEQMVSSISGVSDQREGGIMATETATGVQSSITQSSYITEPYFYYHNQCKRQVLSQALEAAKHAYDGTKKINYILSDINRIQTAIDMDKFSDSEYNVFVTDSSKDKLTIQKLESLGQIALQADKASLSDIITIAKSNSLSEISDTIERSEARKQAENQQIRQEQMQSQQSQIEAQQKLAEEERQFQADQNELDRQNKLDLATISAMGYSEDKDIDKDGNLDVIEMNKLAHEREKVNSAAMEAMKNRAYDSKEKEKDRQLKRNEMMNKMEIEKLRAKTSLKNKVSGEG